jgi:uncharacterized membrane protein
MKSLSRVLKVHQVAVLLVALDFVLLLAVTARLPDPLPLLWSSDGGIIGSMDQPAGALLLPLAHLAVTAFLILAPQFDPGALRTPEPPRFYTLIVASISAAMLLASALIFAAALGASVNVPRSMLGASGVLIAIVGNYLGKLPRNYMVGIRTPWTLASPYVWERTHRFAAPLFVVAGVALFVYSIAQNGPPSAAFVLSLLIVTALAPFLYSCLLWMRLPASEGTGLESR